MKAATSEREEQIQRDKSRPQPDGMRNGRPSFAPTSSSSAANRKTSGTSAATTSAAPKSHAGGGQRSSTSSGVGQRSRGSGPHPRPHDSELRTSFDPMKDLHMWTMWRTAVNGRIMDEVRKKNEHPGHHIRPEGDGMPYGRALVKTPLNRFIRMSDSSQNVASAMMDPHNQGNGHLATTQFVFYGMPRVVLKKPTRP